MDHGRVPVAMLVARSVDACGLLSFFSLLSSRSCFQVEGDFAHKNSAVAVLRECFLSVPKDLGLHSDEYIVDIHDVAVSCRSKGRRHKEASQVGSTLQSPPPMASVCLRACFLRKTCLCHLLLLWRLRMHAAG